MGAGSSSWNTTPPFTEREILKEREDEDQTEIQILKTRKNKSGAH